MAVSSFSVTSSLFVSVSVGALAAWHVSWPACWYCLVYSRICVSSALLTLQNRGHPHRGPSLGHQWGQSERKAIERGHPSPADGRGVRHPQDQKASRPYVSFLFCFLIRTDGFITGLHYDTTLAFRRLFFFSKCLFVFPPLQSLPLISLSVLLWKEPPNWANVQFRSDCTLFPSWSHSNKANFI